MGASDIPWIRKRLRDTPDSPGLHLVLGDLLAGCGHDEEALAELHTAIRLAGAASASGLSPALLVAFARLQMGCLLDKLGRETEARAEWAQVLDSCNGVPGDEPDPYPAWLAAETRALLASRLPDTHARDADR